MSTLSLANAVSMTFLVALISPAYMFVVTRDIWWLKLLAAILGANVVVAGLKEVFAATGWPGMGRPRGAVACDALCVGDAVGGRPGFPSGHMTTAVMFVAALWLHTRAAWVPWIGVPWICAMAWARWAKQCHNVLQIVGGSGFGLLGAYLFYRLV